MSDVRDVAGVHDLHHHSMHSDGGVMLPAEMMRKDNPVTDPKPHSKMTEQQAKAWPEAIAELRRYHEGISDDPHCGDWTLVWSEEARPGRGHHLSATWNDGERFAQVSMDVYGYPSVSIANLDWLHASGWEDCDCEHCEKEREGDND